jgi:20S proteasome subunit beta 6
MSSHAIAQLVSVTLYYRRFFPYYAFCMVAGLDEEGDNNDKNNNKNNNNND